MPTRRNRGIAIRPATCRAWRRRHGARPQVLRREGASPGLALIRRRISNPPWGQANASVTREARPERRARNPCALHPGAPWSEVLGLVGRRSLPQRPTLPRWAEVRSAPCLEPGMTLRCGVGGANLRRVTAGHGLRARSARDPLVARRRAQCRRVEFVQAGDASSRQSPPASCHASFRVPRVPRPG
jgi:hypothetical protein